MVSVPEPEDRMLCCGPIEYDGTTTDRDHDRGPPDRPHEGMQV